MGRETILDPVPGGIYRVRMSDGFAAASPFDTIDPSHQMVFTCGFADSEAAAHTLRHDRLPNAELTGTGDTFPPPAGPRRTARPPLACQEQR